MCIVRRWHCRAMRSRQAWLHWQRRSMGRAFSVWTTSARLSITQREVQIQFMSAGCRRLACSCFHRWQKRCLLKQEQRECAAMGETDSYLCLQRQRAATKGQRPLILQPTPSGKQDQNHSLGRSWDTWRRRFLQCVTGQRLRDAEERHLCHQVFDLWRKRLLRDDTDINELVYGL